MERDTDRDTGGGRGAFQTPKGVCLIGAACIGRHRRRAGVIPDAERRLPHWSAEGKERAALRDLHSRRRKASASLEHRRAGRRLESERLDSRRRKASASLEHYAPIAGDHPRQRFQTPKGVCLIGACSRTLTSAVLEAFQTPKGVCLIGAYFPGVSVAHSDMIPDAERRLPHWSMEIAAQPFHRHPDSRRRKASASLERVFAVFVRRYRAYSRRRKASASLEQRFAGGVQRGGENSRRRKASASLEQQGRSAPPREAHRIPDAERRLPHWSTTVKTQVKGQFRDSRRRKASASLERHRRPSPAPDIRRFQTPKGVCLIGSPCSATRRGRRTGNSRRRKASASLERYTRR